MPAAFLILASVSTGAAVHEFGLNLVTCSPASALTVTRQTSYADGGGAGVDSASLGARSSPRNVGVAGVSSGREHFRLRRRDKSSPRSVGVARVSGGREHFRLRRRSFGCGAETQMSSMRQGSAK